MNNNMKYSPFTAYIYMCIQIYICLLFNLPSDSSLHRLLHSKVSHNQRDLLHFHQKHHKAAQKYIFRNPYLVNICLYMSIYKANRKSDECLLFSECRSNLYLFNLYHEISEVCKKEQRLQRRKEGTKEYKRKASLKGDPGHVTPVAHQD